MRTAFSLWNERIAPVFDVARHLWIVDAADGCIISQTGRRFSSDDPQERALRLTTLQVEQLVCGAISRNAHHALVERGIRVISFIAGDLEHVIHACLSDQLSSGLLNMPGYHRGKGRHTRCYSHRAAHTMQSEQTQE